MGLFSRLLGGADAGKKLSEFTKTVADAAEKAASELADAAETAASELAAAREEHRAQAPAGEERPVRAEGGSFGPHMPEEENQFSYDGSYIEYFEHVFLTEFSGYRIFHEPSRGGKETVFTFLNEEGGKALVVELLSEGSSVCRIRKECALAGIPYLRFYYDHEGWWNTYSYVAGRVRSALGG